MNVFPTRPAAVAYLRGGVSVPRLHGEVRFYTAGDAVMVVAKVSNLPRGNSAGFFGFHIHEGEDCGGEGFENTGSHYTREPSPHPTHAGDLPPLLSVNGQAYLAVQTNRFTIDEIIGRTVVIHEGVDDFSSQPAGNAGRKIACGVIRKV